MPDPSTATATPSPSGDDVTATAESCPVLYVAPVGERLGNDKTVRFGFRVAPRSVLPSGVIDMSVKNVACCASSVGLAGSVTSHSLVPSIQLVMSQVGCAAVSANALTLNAMPESTTVCDASSETDSRSPFAPSNQR